MTLTLILNQVCLVYRKFPWRISRWRFVRRWTSRSTWTGPCSSLTSTRSAWTKSWTKSSTGCWTGQGANTASTRPDPPSLPTTAVRYYVCPVVVHWKRIDFVTLTFISLFALNCSMRDITFLWKIFQFLGNIHVNVFPFF